MKNANTFDLNHIWHPYASVTQPIAPLEVVSAHDSLLTLADGTQMIDAMASWWAAIHGYNHPKLNAAAIDQLQHMSHVMFGGLTHQPAIQLCKKLVDITPDGLSRVFLSDSGSVAVDIALKMAMQYWQEIGRPNKTKFVALRGGYHGDTLGAMSVCDPITGMHHLFRDTLPQQYFADKPSCVFGKTARPDDIKSVQDIFDQHHDTIAALILEPIVQGAGGMFFYSADYLKQVTALCQKYDVLLIADEIATGFGRSGKLFACEHANITPDIMCVGKALTGGYVTLAATLTNDKVANGICGGETGVFMHGPTFMANPLACRIASASIELLEENDWKNHVLRIENRFKSNFRALSTHPDIANVRVLGAIAVIETKNEVNMKKVQQRLPELGVWLRPFGKLIYSLPPYIISDEQIDTITHAMRIIAEECN